MQLTDERQTKLSVLDPGWLIANSLQTIVGTLVYVYRSAAMKDTHRTYKVVRDFVESNCLSLICQEFGPRDVNMIFRRGEILIYGEPGVTEEQARDALSDTD